jgi:hypothetical protein
MAERNASTSSEKRVEFRIGVTRGRERTYPHRSRSTSPSSSAPRGPLAERAPRLTNLRDAHCANLAAHRACHDSSRIVISHRSLSPDPASPLSPSSPHRAPSGARPRLQARHQPSRRAARPVPRADLPSPADDRGRTEMTPAALQARLRYPGDRSKAARARGATRRRSKSRRARSSRRNAANRFRSRARSEIRCVPGRLLRLSAHNNAGRILSASPMTEPRSSVTY